MDHDVHLILGKKLRTQVDKQKHMRGKKEKGNKTIENLCSFGTAWMFYSM